VRRFFSITSAVSYGQWKNWFHWQTEPVPFFLDALSGAVVMARASASLLAQLALEFGLLLALRFLHFAHDVHLLDGRARSSAVSRECYLQSPKHGEGIYVLDSKGGAYIWNRYPLDRQARLLVGHKDELFYLSVRN
jgi:hypothetical protein